MPEKFFELSKVREFNVRNTGMSDAYCLCQGLPFPNSEEHAIDVVVQYAVTRLGFSVDNIIMFAWSIGGYTAAYAAMMYPDIKALVILVN